MKVYVIWDPLFEEVIGVASTEMKAETMIQESNINKFRDNYLIDYDEYEIDRLLDD